MAGTKGRSSAGGISSAGGSSRAGGSRRSGFRTDAGASPRRGGKGVLPAGTGRRSRSKRAAPPPSDSRRPACSTFQAGRGAAFSGGAAFPGPSRKVLASMVRKKSPLGFTVFSGASGAAGTGPPCSARASSTV